MRSGIQLAAIAFVLLLGGLTVAVTADQGFSVLTVASVIVVALLGIGVLGALFERPPDE
jgi:hypothetical protein